MVIDGTGQGVAWYDNEWGYSNRCVELVAKVRRRAAGRGGHQRPPSKADLPRASVRERPLLDGRRGSSVRVDFNVPLEGDGDDAGSPTTRASAPRCRRSSICASAGARLVLVSHLAAAGRRPGALDEAGLARLGELIGADVRWRPPSSGPRSSAWRRAREGEVLMLENSRYEPGETENDPRSRRAGGSGDVYVNDAFGAAHRAHATTEGVAQHLRPRRAACCSSARSGADRGCSTTPSGRSSWSSAAPR